MPSGLSKKGVVDLNNADVAITPGSDTSKLPDPGTYSGTDTISPPPTKPNSIDVYRAKTNAAAKKELARELSFLLTNKPGSGVQCPR